MRPIETYSTIRAERKWLFLIQKLKQYLNGALASETLQFQYFVNDKNKESGHKINPKVKDKIYENNT